MQQASVGGCDEEIGASSPRSASSPTSFAIKSEPVVGRGDGVRVKVEMPEPTEAGVEVKGEPRDDYQQRQPSGNDGAYHHYNDKKPPYVSDASGQPPHPGYRPVGLAGSFGFPAFYGHHHHHHHPAGVAMPASFLATPGRPSPEVPPIGKMIGDGREQTTTTSSTTTAPHLDRHPTYSGRMPLPIPNDGFLHPHEQHHHRFDPADFPHTGVPYTGFRSAPTLRSPYGHQNNSAYSRSGHYHHPGRQRKWSVAAFRGLHPPMPVSPLSSPFS
ncbi:hypothetical protein X777_11932 [Ooceraea biroi]|uniref:Uncharacterized protein n=1 Tax=Ooceraea biroi TaxID=2015173 RepID=A0A026W321_OOCBI|nr:hypothetical protein X777_11932 [Ooceraea biroi]